MNITEQHKLFLFAENAQIIKKSFIWESDSAKRLAALFYAQVDKSVDCAAIRDCHDLIKQNTGFFSGFRGSMSFVLAAMLSLSRYPGQLLDETLTVYELLRSENLRTSDYLVIAAYQLASQSETSRHSYLASRTRNFYDAMKADHFFYTGPDDYIFAAMLALTDLNVTQGTQRIEQIFSRMKDEFWDNNSVQALAQVLVLGDSDDLVLTRVLYLRDALREASIKLDKAYILPILGILALLPQDDATIVRDLVEAQNTLREQKGLGAISVSTPELLSYAASITASAYTEGYKDQIMQATVSTNITNIIIAQQAAAMAAIAASTTAVSG